MPEVSVAFCSKEERINLVSNKETVLLELCDDIDRILISEDGWKTHIFYPFKVFDCTREFESTDNQAKAIAEYIGSHFTGEKNILVQCTYGEVRSVAVAIGIACAWSGDCIETIRDGQRVDGWDFIHSDVFMSRTSSWISQYLTDNSSS